MEVAVRGRNVLLTTHQNYRELDERNVIKDVMNFPPFLQYLAECEASGPLPSAFVIRHIRRIAHRVVDVTLDVTADQEGVPGDQTDAHRVTTQCLRCTETAPALLLPVIVEQETQRRYALLRLRRRLALGLRPSLEAFDGCVQQSADENMPLCCTTPHDSQLSALGFDLNKMQPVTTQGYTLGDEGHVPLRLYTVSTTFTEAQLMAFRQNNHFIANPSRELAAHIKGSEEVEHLVAVPLAETMSCADLKTRLVCALCNVDS